MANHRRELREKKPPESILDKLKLEISFPKTDITASRKLTLESEECKKLNRHDLKNIQNTISSLQKEIESITEEVGKLQETRDSPKWSWFDNKNDRSNEHDGASSVFSQSTRNVYPMMLRNNKISIWESRELMKTSKCAMDSIPEEND